MPLETTKYSTYIDPSELFHSQNGVLRTPNLEDYCIAVDLEVECPKRNNKSKSNDGRYVLQFQSKVNRDDDNTRSLLGGTSFQYEDKDSKKQAVLKYITNDGIEYIYGDRKNDEMFGIKSIFIDYSTFFVPNVTIVFSDVRGISLFSVEEAAHQGVNSTLNGRDELDEAPDNLTIKDNKGKKIDMVRSFFECFFRFPYPTFRLKVKGLYGKPISYELSVLKCNSRFDASSGSFDVTANMIGYAYSMLNDITMNALLAAPNADKWGQQYWQQKFGTKQLPYGGGLIPKLSEVLISFAKAETKAKELQTTQDTNVDTTTASILTSIIDSYNDLTSALADYFNSSYINGGHGYIDIYANAGYLLSKYPTKQATKDSKVLENINEKINLGNPLTVDKGGKIYDAMTSLRNNLQRFRSQPNKAFDLKQETYNTLSNLLPTTRTSSSICKRIKDGYGFTELVSHPPIMQASKETTIYFKTEDERLYNKLITFPSINNDIISTLGTVTTTTGSDTRTEATILTNTNTDYSAIYLFDAGDAYNDLTTVKSYYIGRRVEAEGKLEALTRLYADTLGFQPTIGNIMAILIAHLETFLYCIRSCELDIYSNGVWEKRTFNNFGLKPKDVSNNATSIVPFPLINEVVNGQQVRSWTGIINDPEQQFTPETKLVNTLLDGIDIMNAEAEESRNILLTEASGEPAFDGGVISVLCPLFVSDFLYTSSDGEDDSKYSPFGKSVANIVESNGDETLYKILKIRRMHCGKNNINSYGLGNEKKLGKIDAYNFMYMHQDDIVTTYNIADRFLNNISTFNSGNIKVAYEEQNVSDEYLVPYMGYTISETDTISSTIQGGKLLPSYYGRYRKWKKGITTTTTPNNYKLANSFKYKNLYDRLIEGKNLTDSDCQTELSNHELYKQEILGYSSDSNKNIYNSFMRLKDDPYAYIYRDSNVKKISLVDNTYTDEQQSTAPQPVTSKFADIENQFIFSFTNYDNTIMSVFGNPEYYDKNEDEKAKMFLESISYRNCRSMTTRGIITDFNILVSDNGKEYAYISNYANLLLIGCELYIQSGNTSISESQYNEHFVTEYKRWRDASDGFQYIKNIYELKNYSGSPLTSNQVRALSMYIINNGGEIVKSSSRRYVYKDFSEVDFKQWTKQVGNIQELFTSTGIPPINVNGSSVIVSLHPDFGANYSTYIVSTQTENRSHQLSYGLKLYNKPGNIIDKITSVYMLPYITFVSYGIDDNFGLFHSDINDLKPSVDYLKSFIQKFKELKEAQNTQVQQEQASAATESVRNEINRRLFSTDDIHVELYNYLKTLYDRWLCGNSFHGDNYNYYERYGYDEFYNKHFYFIDTYYNKIGGDVLLNLEHIIDEIYNSLKNRTMSLLEFITSICSKNNIQFLCIQNFSDFSKDECLSEAFSAITFDQCYGMTTTDTVPDFVCLYANQASQHLDILANNDYGYNDDSFDVRLESDLDKVCFSESDKRQCKIPAFGVNYGSMYQHFFKDINVEMDSSMATDQSIKATFAIASSNNQTDTNEITSLMGQDLYSIYSVNSYKCELKMVGSAWIQPLMYFQLNNVPMYHGAYQVKKVTHEITPGNMETTIIGVRQANIGNRYVNSAILSGRGSYIEENSRRQSASADTTNNCAYQFFSPYEDDTQDTDTGYTTNIDVMKNTYHDNNAGSVMNLWTITVNQVLNDAKNLDCLEDEMAIKLLASELYVRVKWHNNIYGGWKNVLSDDKTYKYIHHDYDSSLDPNFNTHVQWITDVFEKTPSIMVNKETSLSYFNNAGTLTTCTEAVFYSGGVIMDDEHGNIVKGKRTVLQEFQIEELTHHTKWNMYPSADDKTYSMFQHGPIVFKTKYGVSTPGTNQLNPLTCWEIGHNDNSIEASRNTINRTAAEERLNVNDLTIGLKRSIVKTKNKTDKIKNITLLFSPLVNDDKQNGLAISCNSIDSYGTIFDMILNCYYDYISRLEWQDNENGTSYIVLRSHDQKNGATTRQIKYIKNGHVHEIEEGVYPNELLSSIYKKYLINKSINDEPYRYVKTNNTNIHFNECENFKGIINLESDDDKAVTFNSLFNISIQECPSIGLVEYYETGSSPISNEQMNSLKSEYVTLTDYCKSNTARRNNINNNPPESFVAGIMEFLVSYLDRIYELCDDHPQETGGSANLKLESGYRSSALNSLLGSKETSDHLYGNAADLHMKRDDANHTKLVNLYNLIMADNTLHSITNQVIYEISNSSGSHWLHVAHHTTGRGNNKRQFIKPMYVN